MRYVLFDNLPEMAEINRQLCRVSDVATEYGSTTVTEGGDMTFMTAGDAKLELSGLPVEGPEFVALSDALRLYNNGVRWLAEVRTCLQFDRVGGVRVKFVAELYQRSADGRKHSVGTIWTRVCPSASVCKPE